MKKQAALKGHDSGLWSKENADEYDEDYMDALEFGLNDDGEISDSYALGTVRQRKVNQMVEAQTMISRTGWLEVNRVSAEQEGKFMIPTLRAFSSIYSFLTLSIRYSGNNFCLF